MNMIVSLMAAGAKKRFTREEYRRIREEANALFQNLTEENKDLPKALKKHNNRRLSYHCTGREEAEKREIAAGTLRNACCKKVDCNAALRTEAPECLSP